MTRRNFLKINAGVGLSYIASLALIAPFTSLEAAPGDYKALVCVFLEGGNDAFNMMVPTSTTEYNSYAAVRGDIALNKGDLLALSGTHEGVNYGFHPAIPELQNLYNSGDLAIISNVGTLVEPISSASSKRPNNLFSHNSQQALWMFGDAKNSTAQGWASRLADRFGWNNPYTNINVDGNSPFQDGGETSAFEIKNKIGRYRSLDAFDLSGSGQKIGEAYELLMAVGKSHAHPLVKAYATSQERAITYQNEVGIALESASSYLADFPKHPHEAGQPLREQLALVLQLIEQRTIYGAPEKQVYFVRQHGWDSHDVQLSAHSANLGYLSDCLSVFYSKLQALGLTSQVTTFTASEFGRSLVPNGDGTDHGWGGHALVLGGAVNGGAIYGRVPRVEPDSPDAIAGRMVPDIAVEEYGAKLVKWLEPSATTTDLKAIFPNLQTFLSSDFSTSSSFMQS